MTPSSPRRRRPLAARALFICALAIAASTATLAQAGTTPVGIWETIDDHTGQPTALIQIASEPDGTLSGSIVKGLEPDSSPDRRCTACTDWRKDRPMLGLQIIDGMKQDGAGWSGGHILDPENGSLYRCAMRLEDGGRKLVVRGYLGISLLGRSQTWLRQN